MQALKELWGGKGFSHRDLNPNVRGGEGTWSSCRNCESGVLRGRVRLQAIDPEV